MPNKNDRLVIAYYADRQAAEAAAEHLKAWDEANDDIKLGAIAVLTFNPNTGKLEADEVGERQTKSGALWGTAIGATVGILTGGIGLIPGLLVGAGAGAGTGALFHKDVIMTDEERAQLIENLRGGGAALAVMADDFEVEATRDEMLTGGTKTEAYIYLVSPEEAEALTATAAAQADASEAVEEAVAELAEETAEAAEAVSVDVPDLAPEAAAVVAGLVAVGGLSPVDAAKLYEAGGIYKVSALLEMAATPQGRQELAEATGLDADTILTAANRLDLMRVKGVGVRYSALLLAGGVDTVPELAQRNPKNLRVTLVDVNEAENIVEEMPSEEMLAGWVGQAKELPRIITY